jgi:hypothetical protein
MHNIILEKETDFPHIQNLTMKNLVPMRGFSIDRGACGACARTVLRTKAHARVCGVEYPRACDKLLRKKLRMDFSRFSCESTG